MESPLLDFERVARVEHDDASAGVVVAGIEPARQRRRIDRGRTRRSRANRRMVHPNDFALDLDQQLAERDLARPAFLRCERREASIAAQPANEAAHLVGRAGDEQVDAFLGEQHRALQ